MTAQPAAKTYPPHGPLDFHRSEYDARIAAVRAELSGRGADLLLVDQIDHLAYLFGYLATAARYQAALIPAQGEPIGMEHRIERGQLGTLPGERILYSRWTEQLAALRKLTSGMTRVAMQNFQESS